MFILSLAACQTCNPNDTERLVTNCMEANMDALIKVFNKQPREVECRAAEFDQFPEKDFTGLSINREQR